MKRLFYSFFPFVVSQIFLPTDDAFDAAGITNTSVSALPQPVVTNLLLYHLLDGAVDTDALFDATDFYTLFQVRSMTDHIITINNGGR